MLKRGIIILALVATVALPFILLIVLLLTGRTPFSSRRDIAAAPTTSRTPLPRPVSAAADAGPPGWLSTRTAWRVLGVAILRDR